MTVTPAVSDTKSLFIKKNGEIQKYTWNWSAKAGQTLYGTAIEELDIRSVVEIDVRLASGYPVFL